VPVISTFFGIIITMNYREHGPPHFHAWYSGHDVTVKIADGSGDGRNAETCSSTYIGMVEHSSG
jgi:hypothetical protein